MGRVDGKVAIVTGAGSGIGAGTARLLAREGARVVVADVNPDGANQTVRAIRDEGGDAVASVTDVSNEAQVRSMIETATGEWGRLDILHNNAAATYPSVMLADKAAVDIDVSVWDEVMAVNLRGCWLGCKHGIPAMIEGGRGGSIINTSSSAAIRGDLLYTAYGASKAGVNALTLYVATQYGRQRIRCNALMPGQTLTPAARHNQAESTIRMIASHIPIPRFAEPEDHAQLVLFLGSDEASYITGQIIRVDGGSHCHTETYAERVGDSWV
jgi:NAD(P)-dependent dehydrogenase (short-subunit alcohol dehydrogenase family)